MYKKAVDDFPGFHAALLTIEISVQLHISCYIDSIRIFSVDHILFRQCGMIHLYTIDGFHQEVI